MTTGGCRIGGLRPQARTPSALLTLLILPTHAHTLHIIMPQVGLLGVGHQHSAPRKARSGLTSGATTALTSLAAAMGFGAPGDAPDGSAHSGQPADPNAAAAATATGTAAAAVAVALAPPAAGDAGSTAALPSAQPLASSAAGARSTGLGAGGGGGSAWRRAFYFRDFVIYAAFVFFDSTCKGGGGGGVRHGAMLCCMGSRCRCHSLLCC